MADYDYDLFVIGAGSGGVRAARLAAVSGARVAVAEEHRVGGTCVIRGCIPKKFMVYASEFSQHFKTARGYGWTVGETSFDWQKFITAKDIEIARLSGIYVSNLENAGAELLHGRAVLEDASRRPRRRARHYLQRGLPPAGTAQADPGRGRRLHRGGVRRHLQRPRR